MKSNRYLIYLLLAAVLIIAAFVLATILIINVTQATLVSGGVLAITLAVLAYELYLENRESKILAYERLRSDFMRASLAIVNHPQVYDFLYHANPNNGNDKNYDLHRKMTILYLDTLLGLFERAWKNLRIKKMEEEWNCWRNWLKLLSCSEGFDEVRTEGIYDKGFVDEIKRIKEDRVC
ncbi:MAG TPA: hypothetical protein VK487_00865 [Candidatus Bathyarchaeia archaeon]|nr:hypothetical protein [Candidatus Bathyarchaeia archaeon]